MGIEVIAKTYAEFLNKTYSTNYKAWYKSTYNLDDDYVVWMIRLDSKERDGYRNYMEGKNIIEESNKPTRSNKPIRIVFQVIDNKDKTKTFKLLGCYKQLKELSTQNRRVFTYIPEKM